MWHLYISCLLPSGYKRLKDYASSEVFARKTADSDICHSGLQQRECFKCNSSQPHHRSLRVGCLWLQHSTAGTKIHISVITKVISVFSVEGLNSTSGMDPDVNFAAVSCFVKMDSKQSIRS